MSEYKKPYYKTYKTSFLHFRVPVPQITNNNNLLTYKRILISSAIKYLKEHHPTVDRKKVIPKFQEIYDNILYLQFSIAIQNHKNQNTIIDINV